MTKELIDVVVVGAGPSGLTCAIEAKKYGLSYVVLEKGGITNSILRFPTQMILDRKSTRLNSSHIQKSRMPSSA